MNNSEYTDEHNNIGVEYCNQGRYNEALMYYKNVLKYKDDNIEAYFNIGNIYCKQRKYEEALSYYKKGLKYKECLYGYKGIGDIYAEQKKYEEALMYYKKALEYKKDDAIGLYINIGILYAEQKKYEEALIYYKKALEYDRKTYYPNIYNDIGTIHAEQENYKEALMYYKKALEYKEDYLDAYINIIIVYYHQKNYKETLKYIKKILKKEKIDDCYQILGLYLLDILNKNDLNVEDYNLLIDKKLYFSYHVLQKIIENIKDIENRVPNFGKMLREKLRENITKNNFKKNSTNQLSDGIFYMCKSINKYTIESLINKGVYKNKVTNFNDPFDPYFKMLNSDIIETLNKVRITCFSEEEDNLLLWAHYADNHKGICLGYSIMENDNSYFEKIIYKSFRMKKNADYILTKSLSEFEIQENNITLSDFYLRKNENWQYEKEYRLIHLDIENEEDYYKNVILKEVIFGMNTEIKDIKLIYEIVKNIYGKSSNIKFYKMREGKDLTIEKFPLDEWANNNGIELNSEN